MRAEHAWQAVLGQLQIEMPRSSFDTWVKDSQFVAFEDGLFIVGVNNAYARDWLESRLKSTVTRILRGLLTRSAEVRFVVWEQDAPKEELELAQAAQPLTEATKPLPSGINDKYQFESFVVATCNRLASASALSVAEKPGEFYNPLFIYGPPGHGKTHLLQAIGNEAHERGFSVLFCSAEQFTNELIQAIRSRKTEEFRSKYRSPDVLLIDDIQFIEGKQSTQEEFFHCFNALHSANKQIVISSDRAPKQLSQLDERLRTRLAWGLVADVHRTDLETRLSILKHKCLERGVAAPGAVLQAIAEAVSSSVRELEGALNRVLAFAQVQGLPLTVDLVASCLTDFVSEAEALGPEEVLELVAETYSLSVEQLLSKSRSRHVAFPRQIAMFLLRENSGFSLPQIGEILGGRDHSTVLYGADKVSALVDTDEDFRREVSAIQQKLG